MEERTTWESDAVLADGGTVHLRPAQPGDRAAVAACYERLSDESRYLRFLSSSSPERSAALERLDDSDQDRHFVMVAELGGDVVALARYDQQGPEVAEVAFTVQDDQQGRGLGTLLLEHLAVVARTRGIRRFVATALGANRKMLRVFEDAGFGVEQFWDHGVAHVAFEIAPTPTSTDVRLRREHVSEARSIARVLAPQSVAVVGVGRSQTSIGRAVLRNLLDGGFQGPVYPITPNLESVEGLRAFPSVLDIRGEVDLAILAVPAQGVLDVARQCVRKGMHGLVVISAGFGEVPGGRERERELIKVARGGGMRVIGPNCMGVLNTGPEVRMNATFAPSAPPTGRVAFASQSGGLGIGLLGRAQEIGIGISTFVSMGNKADVSGNDLLQYWEDDPATDVVLLYLESFGNPRKFARLARRVGQTKPVVAVKSGRSLAGARGTSSHTAALAVPDVAVDALFQQAGVIRVDGLEELFDVARVLAHQPLPDGRCVGIVSNGGGPAILAADACVASGLDVNELNADTQAELRSFVSPDAAVTNPVDLVASATPETFGRTVRLLLDAHDIDSLIVIFVAPIVTRTDEVVAAIAGAVAESDSAKPVVACLITPNERPEAEDDGPVVPIFDFPESAARALARVVEHAEWRRRPVGEVPELDDVDDTRAEALVAEQLARGTEGAWLDPVAADELLGCFGIPTATPQVVETATDAQAVASHVGYPVVLKAAAADLVHKTEIGGVRLGLSSPSAVRSAFEKMRAALGERMGGAVIQPTVAGVVETIVGVTHDPSFGPLVLFGMGGVQAELMRDSAVRLAPLTDVDSHALVRSLRGSALLFGYRGSPAVDVAALEDLLVRVGVLAQRLPEVVELDCNPVIAGPTGVTAVDVKVRVVPVELGAPADLRRLRPPR